jgi:hypothetical protein
VVPSGQCADKEWYGVIHAITHTIDPSGSVMDILSNPGKGYFWDEIGLGFCGDGSGTLWDAQIPRLPVQFGLKTPVDKMA